MLKSSSAETLKALKAGLGFGAGSGFVIDRVEWKGPEAIGRGFPYRGLDESAGHSDGARSV
jgi:hypothetical protein